MSALLPNPAEDRFAQILRPSHVLCKDDVVWMLEYIKKKVAEKDPRLLELSQPRLLQNYQYYSETAMLLIHRRSMFDQEADRLKAWLREAAYGLYPNPEDRQPF
ncbi:hypothetical protein MJA45_11555 [Paenibacillus aurantius]|uniref:Uncharacterized protein n=1 Tax=Paenibacillus aurantius TaxID=2918900 RepID=A0AA96RH35_9BACL|nr:hypothetical protein [Paenibacillus aurantius]WNQ13617.1 hypothetical protein MJA45_11555 [Paenibacillus aurantius]